MKDDIFPDGVVFFEDLVFDASTDQDLHLMLDSPGGDGETAVRASLRAGLPLAGDDVELGTSTTSVPGRGRGMTSPVD